MDIIKCLTISTAHISKSTAEALEKECTWTNESIGLCVYGKHCFGWYISVPDESDMEDYEKTVPSDLIACLNLAIENDCNLLCIDRDGETVSELNTYDWN